MDSGNADPGFSSRSAWSRASLGAGGAVVLLALLLWTGGGIPDWRHSAFLHVMGLAGLIGAAVSFLGRAAAGGASFDRLREAGRLSTGAATALLILLALLVASASLSAHPALGFRRVGAWICLAAWAYLLARKAGITENLRGLMILLGGLAAMASAASLLDSLSRSGATSHTPIDNPNHVGALTAAGFLLLTTLAAQEARPRLRVVFAGLLLVTGAGLVACRSTAALFALAAGLMTAAGGWAAARAGMRQDRAAGILASLFVLAALLVPQAAGAGPLAERSGMAGVARVTGSDRPTATKRFSLHWQRLKALASANPDLAVAARLRYSRASLEALRQGPLMGFGPGSVPLTFAQYRLQVPGASPWGEAVGQLHSVGVQRLYEGGVAGLSAFAAWILLSLLGSAHADRRRARLRAGLAAATAALVVAGAADALETAPVVAAVGMAFLALLASRPEARASERAPAWVLRVAGGVCAVAALAIGADFARADLAQGWAEKSIQRVKQSGFDERAAEGLRRSARLDGALGLYEHQAAYAVEELALDRTESGDTEAGQRLFDEAERLYRRAAQRFPEVPGFASQAGNFLLDRERPQEALPFLLKGAALDYYDPLGHFYLGEAYRLSGRGEEAVEAYARSVRYFPRMADALLWSDPAQRVLYRRVLERVREMVLAESSRRASGSTAARLLEWVQARLEQPLREETKRTILVHRFDLIPTVSRSWHLFARAGFTIENLPVTVLDRGDSGDEGEWARVLDGLPILTAASVEAGTETGGKLLRSRQEEVAGPGRRRVFRRV